MSTIITAALLFASATVALLVSIFFVEVVAALVSKDTSHLEEVGRLTRSRCAVLVPAHNEAAGLPSTLKDIMIQIRAGDRVLVVADNCTDETAAVARTAGAEVVERNDPERRGKGYALDFGMAHLASDSPDILVIIDADCRVHPNTLGRLVRACALTGRPVQALDLMVAPASSPVDHRFSEFAWRIKNLARPLGLKALRLPCQLMGTGMAFPWTVIRSADLATGHLVEDLKLGLELARDGHAAIFCPSALVTSEFPSSAAAAETQRKRWEGGHITISARVALPLFLKGVSRGNLDLMALALDSAVPPLTLLAFSAFGIFIVSGVAYLFALTPVPLLISSVSLAAFFVAIWLCWLRYGRDLLPLRYLPGLAPFARNKMRLYVHVIRGRTGSEWVRTERRPLDDENTR